MRPIDADELKKQSYVSTDWDSDGIHLRVVDESDIDNAPTIDVVEVVRCEDCLFFEHYWCALHENTMYDNDFCSYGERKDGNNK